MFLAGGAFCLISVAIGVDLCYDNKMFDLIKSRIDKELVKFVKQADQRYSLTAISPLLFKNIKDFILRPGKRVRPVLFAVGYKALARKTPANLYLSAVSFELLHDFMLIHDDIIDKSDTRRGKPSMHKMFNIYLAKHKNIKFNGQDLAIVTGDILYAMAIDAFLSIKENCRRKEKALKKFIAATIFTGGGEFIELLLSLKDIGKISKQDIYRIYDSKTAYYTFAYPLVCGATLAGAGSKQINRLIEYGLYLGRAFQIKDDILGMFSEENVMGKSSLTDLQEAKKTVLIWYAYNHAGKQYQRLIRKIFAKENINREDLLLMRRIITAGGAKEYAKREIYRLVKKAQDLSLSFPFLPRYKDFLRNYPRKLLLNL